MTNEEIKACQRIAELHQTELEILAMEKELKWYGINNLLLPLMIIAVVIFIFTVLIWF